MIRLRTVKNRRAEEEESLLAVFFAFNQLPEISFRFGWALIFSVLVALLNNVQNPFDGSAGSGDLANFELDG